MLVSTGAFRSTHLALVAMDQDWMISFVEDLHQSRANHVLWNVIERLLVSWNAKLLT
jgi:hypothetical protein